MPSDTTEHSCVTGPSYLVRNWCVKLMVLVPFLSTAFLYWPSHCPLKPSPSRVTNIMLFLLRAMSDMKTCRPYAQRHCFTDVPVERQQNTWNIREASRNMNIMNTTSADVFWVVARLLPDSSQKHTGKRLYEIIYFQIHCTFFSIFLPGFHCNV